MRINEFTGHSRGELRGELLLTITALIWGLSFVAQRDAAATLGPFGFNFYRYIIAFFCILPLIAFRRKRPEVDLKVTVIGALVLALVLFGGSGFQQAGLGHTTAGKSGFITSLYVIMVPLFGLFFRRKPTPAIWVGAILAIVGLYLLSVDTEFRRVGFLWLPLPKDGFAIGLGELFSIFGAFFWAVQIMMNSDLVAKVDVLIFTAIQFLVVALLNIGIAVPLEGFPVPSSPLVWIELAYTGIFANAVAFLLQLEGQRLAHPARASLVMSLESLFAAIGGILILGEPLTPRIAQGGLLMFAGIVVAQIQFAPKRGSTITG